MSVTLEHIRDQVIPAAASLLPGVSFDDRAVVMLLAIGLQESRFQHRKQIRGPARGFWQFEAGGGTLGVLTHHASAGRAATVARERLGQVPSYRVVNDKLAEDDILACAFARLLLWTDPRPLPALGAAQDAWDYYIRNWRPGKPHRHTWDGLYAQALQAAS